jgi:hypothetical protein
LGGGGQRSDNATPRPNSASRAHDREQKRVEGTALRRCLRRSLTERFRTRNSDIASPTTRGAGLALTGQRQGRRSDSFDYNSAFVGSGRGLVLAGTLWSRRVMGLRLGRRQGRAARVQRDGGSGSVWACRHDPDGVAMFQPGSFGWLNRSGPGSSGGACGFRAGADAVSVRYQWR